MQRIRKHKLSLQRETIQQLDPAALAVVAGGNIPWSKVGPKGNTCDSAGDTGNTGSCPTGGSFTCANC